MSHPIDLSIIIVNWNSADFLRKCLSSLGRNIAGLSSETIVVDNASFDGCDRLIREEFPQVKFIQSRVNLGFSGANNLAFANSTGRNLLFLNPDTEVVGPALQQMFSQLESDAGVGIVGARLLNTDLTVQKSCIQRFPTLLNQALDADYLRRVFPKSGFWGIQRLLDADQGPAAVDAVSGACLMIRRSVFEQVGRFNTNYFMYAEDVDLCFKVRRAGGKVHYVGNAAVIHHGGRSTASKLDNGFANIVFRESRFKFMRENHGNIYAVLYQFTMAVVAVCRLLLLGLALGLTMGRFRRLLIDRAMGKWYKVFRWAIGLEGWVKQLSRREASLLHE